MAAAMASLGARARLFGGLWSLAGAAEGSLDAAKPALRLGARAAAAQPARWFATEGGEAATKESHKEAFLKKWQEEAPSTLDPPSLASEFLEEREPVAEGAAVPSKVKFNFYLPHGKPYQNAEVDMVLIPALTGDFGVMPGHVPTVAQLRPGILSVQEEADKDMKKFFVSSGFAFVHADSTADVCAIEAVSIEDLDAAAVKAGLADYTAKQASATSSGNEQEAAAAQVGVEVYSAMNAALEGK
mmetsp:Transcript_5394/g.14072  ORF Transcript_5394/g.14072 Transcript_5394/m.14072 type:complete len:243 (-) Transcript_5394:134-862(-)